MPPGPTWPRSRRSLQQLEATLPPLAQAARAAATISSPSSPAAFRRSCRRTSSALASLTLPSDLPLSLPSVIVKQRPDVLQAEANMHAASAAGRRRDRQPPAQHHAHRATPAATRFRSARSSAPAPASGTSAPRFSHRFSTAEHCFMQQRARARRLPAVAPSSIEAPSSPRSRMSPTRWSRIDHDAETLKSTAAAADAAKTSLDLARLQYKDGYDRLSRRAERRADLPAGAAQPRPGAGGRFADTAALFQALGGGWWHRPESDERCKCAISACPSRRWPRSLALGVAVLLVLAGHREQRDSAPVVQRPADQGAAQRTSSSIPSFRSAIARRSRPPARSISTTTRRPRSCRRSPAR